MPPGCNLGPKPPWCRPRCERLTSFYCSVINTPISGELESHTLLMTANSTAPLLDFFFFFFFFFLFFLCHTFFFFFLPLPSVSQGEQYLASHFMDLRSAFFRVDVGRHMQKSTGGIAKGRDRVGEIKVCHINSAPCESAYQHLERR